MHILKSKMGKKRGKLHEKHEMYSSSDSSSVISEGTEHITCMRRTVSRKAYYPYKFITTPQLSPPFFVHK